MNENDSSMLLQRYSLRFYVINARRFFFIIFFFKKHVFFSGLFRFLYYRPWIPALLQYRDKSKI